ncbi:MAG: response regulator [bacterium]
MKKKLILVVEDEPDIRLFFELVLREAGFEVVTAGNGIEALERLRENTPDLISLDLVMPKKSGARFFYEMRKNREWAWIPVLVVTAHARDDLGVKDITRLTDTRMLSGRGIYLEKPVTPVRYVNCVRKMLHIPIPEEKDDPVYLKSKVFEMLQKADVDVLKQIILLLEKP